MSSREQDMNKNSHQLPQHSVAETLVTIVCNHPSNIPYIFVHCDFLVLNKRHEKKLQVKIFLMDSHTEGQIMKAS